MFSFWSKRRKVESHRTAKELRRSTLQVEQLEDRVVPATITVNGTADAIAMDNQVSLREAIKSINDGMDVNEVAGARQGNYGTDDKIEFAITGAGPHVINLTSSLTITIATGLTINGYSQANSRENGVMDGEFGSAITAVLKIVINNGGGVTDGIRIRTDDTTIKGLVIQNFAETGIDIDGNNNKIQGNFIGTNAAGDAKAANSDGVAIDTGTGNLIGGTNKEDRNLISGNNNIGVLIWIDSDSNQVLGNYIGTDITGTGPLGNGKDGIAIFSASQNRIGGTEDEAPNLISGNSEHGIAIIEAGSLLNRIEHNRIGTKANGAAALANGGHGVYINEAAYTIVGGYEANKRNIISGNTQSGVHITGEQAVSNSVIGNYIGTDVNGTAAVGNNWGVVVDGAADTLIGDYLVGSRNVISGNGTGIVLNSASNTIIQSNFIGTNNNGDDDVPNSIGISIFGGSDNTIGGSRENNEGNVISGNGGSGVEIVNSNNNKIKGNIIGLDKDGSPAPNPNSPPIPNGGNGIYIHSGSQGTIIGGSAQSDRNIISGNNVGTSAGIQIRGATTSGTWVENNYIGTDKDGMFKKGNRFGIVLELAPPDTIIIDNLISGNLRKAISGPAGPWSVIIQNKMGLNMNGAALPNEEGGISIDGNGIAIEDNEIWYNGGPGIEVVDGTGHTISRNSIAFNDGLGIDLNEANGANNLQDAPVLTSARVANLQTTIQGTLQSAPDTTFTLEFFVNNVESSGEAQGEYFLGSESVTTDAYGYATFSFTFNEAFDDYITATATDPDGNTSEFSVAVPITTSISGRTWADENQDGLQDVGEAVFAGVTVRLLDGSLSLVDEIETDSNGDYSFSNLAPGDYYVEFVAPTDYVFTLQNQGSNPEVDSDPDLVTGQTGLITVYWDQDASFIDAGFYFGLATVSGRAFEDLNGDGIQDQGEPDFAGIAVALYTSGNVLVATTYTDSEGRFTFEDVTPGEYYLDFTAPQDYEFTLQDQGSDDAVDSDVDIDGLTAYFILLASEENDDLAAGLVSTL